MGAGTAQQRRVFGFPEPASPPQGDFVPRPLPDAWRPRRLTNGRAPPPPNGVWNWDGLSWGPGPSRGPTRPLDRLVRRVSLDSDGRHVPTVPDAHYTTSEMWTYRNRRTDENVSVARFSFVDFTGELLVSLWRGPSGQIRVDILEGTDETVRVLGQWNLPSATQSRQDQSGSATPTTAANERTESQGGNAEDIPRVTEQASPNAASRQSPAVAQRSRSPSMSSVNGHEMTFTPAAAARNLTFGTDQRP